MALIDIGAAAIIRGTDFAGAITIIGKENPANDTGTITSVEVYFIDTTDDTTYATFEKVNGADFTARGSQNVGSVAGGSKQTSSGLDIGVTIGDYLGVWWDYGNKDIYRDSSGEGWWSLAGDQTGCTSTTFNFADNQTISLYGTGETVGVTHELAGVIAGVASVSGSIINQKWLAGVVAGVASVSGAIARTLVMAGVSTGAASVSGAIVRILKLAGVSSGVATAAATLTNQKWLAGIIAGRAVVTATLTNIKWLAGVIAGVASVTGILTNIKWLAGIIAGVATASANLFHVRVAIRVLSAVRNLLALRNIPPVR